MRQAFTLIELLVVVTIIVVLLALLVPALDKAMYQARLAVCGANLRAMGWMATTYTQDNKKYYPERKITLRPVATLVTTQDATAGATVDERRFSGGRLLNEWLPLNKVFNDPLCETIDVDGSLPTSELELSYNIWWGFKYIYPTTNAAQEQGMYRLYGKFSYTPYPATNTRYTFDFLASDLEALNGSGPVPAASGSSTAFTSHPDNKNVTYNTRLQDEAEPGGNATSLKYTYSKWSNRNVGTRPPVDLNYVRADMSVTRYNGVTFDEQSRGKRMVNVPWLRSVDHNFSYIVHLPQ